MVPKLTSMSDVSSIRHTFAHLLAAAVLEKYPKTKLGIGPAIENGFYYDFLFATPIKESALAVFEDSIKRIIRQNISVEGREVSFSDAKKQFSFFQPLAYQSIIMLNVHPSLVCVFMLLGFVIPISVICTARPFLLALRICRLFFN